MYWIFAIFFIVSILVPDIIRTEFLFLDEERAEELAIFVLGSVAFLIFVQKERRLAIQKKEKEKTQKKMDQTVKDLVDSYSYIGEVNRKMDLLMGVALGLADHSILDGKKEKEIYESIIDATNFLLKADSTVIRFVDLSSNRTKKEIGLSENHNPNISNKELTDMGENVNVKKYNETLIISSPQKIKNVKIYLLISGYDEIEERKPKNIEILKLFTSQVLFLYSYMLKNTKKGNCD
jgi:hypothetical protein